MKNPIVDKVFTNQNYSGTKLVAREYDSCTFANCNFSDADISTVIFLECKFVDCNFTKVVMKQTAFRDECVFERCKLLGANFTGCDTFIFSAMFIGCILDYASFYGLEIKNTQFINCRLTGVDFTEATITGSLFDNCDLANATFERTIAEKVDFRTALNFDIDPEKNKIKKAKFSKDNLIGLLRKYNLVIE